MTVTFNPKTNAIRPPATDPNAKSDTTPAGTADPFSDPVQTVSEMDILFSGSRRLQNVKAEHPMAPIAVPDLEKDVFAKLPALASNQSTFNAILNHYQVLRQNLLERRNNYTHTLEGYLKPEEAYDLYDRIEEVDRALGTVEDNIAKAKQWLKNNPQVFENPPPSDLNAVVGPPTAGSLDYRSEEEDIPDGETGHDLGRTHIA